MFEVRVTVGLKKGVSDPEGTNTLKALKLLGFSQVESVKTTRTFDLLINENDKKTVEKKVNEMCQRLLINPVIHDYGIDIMEK
jgi:phosphoribosylformylglycinamidine synthase subunit PurS